MKDSSSMGYRWGYVRDGQARDFVRRESPEDRFYCRFTHCEREPLDFRRECIETARRIRDETDLPIWVLASGGMDSEIVIRSFHAAGIPVRVAINLYHQNLNLHDVAFAIALCQSLGIQYRVFNDIDLEEFYLSDALEPYAEIAQTITVPLIPLVGLLEHLDGYTISGTGTLDFLRRGYYVPGALQDSGSTGPRHRLREIGGLRTQGFERLRRKLGELGPLRRDRFLCYWQSEESFRNQSPPTDDSGWDMWTKEGWHLLWYKVRQYYGKAGTAFFRYTPELALAFIRHPAMQRLLNEEAEAVDQSDTAKYRVYRDAWPELAPREKRNGLELMPQRLRWALQDRLIDRQPYVNAIHRYSYEQLLHDLQPTSGA